MGSVRHDTTGGYRSSASIIRRAAGVSEPEEPDSISEGEIRIRKVTLAASSKIATPPSYGLPRKGFTLSPENGYGRYGDHRGPP